MTIKRFIIHLLAMAAFIVIVLLGVLLWLRVYTNHGQKLELPDYRNQSIEEARQDAEDKSFELIVNDSLFKVGSPGGIILNQNPSEGALVKENRKVYVDITRYNATKNRLSDLPVMYGREYESVKRSLTHLEINANIKNYNYDAGEPDHILEVWYEGELIDGHEGRRKDINIETGSQLDFVLSKKEGGQVPVPELVCERLGIARWKLQTSKLKLGRIEKRGIVPANLDSAYIIQQMPAYTDSSKIAMGEAINVLVVGEKPENCY